MKGNFIKKIVSLVLAFTIVFTNFSVGAFATGEGEAPQAPVKVFTVNFAGIGESATTHQAQFNEGDTVTFTGDANALVFQNGEKVFKGWAYAQDGQTVIDLQTVTADFTNVEEGAAVVINLVAVYETVQQAPQNPLPQAGDEKEGDDDFQNNEFESGLGGNVLQYRNGLAQERLFYVTFKNVGENGQTLKKVPYYTNSAVIYPTGGTNVPKISMADENFEYWQDAQGNKVDLSLLTYDYTGADDDYVHTFVLTAVYSKIDNSQEGQEKTFVVNHYFLGGIEKAKESDVIKLNEGDVYTYILPTIDGATIRTANLVGVSEIAIPYTRQDSIINIFYDKDVITQATVRININWVDENGASQQKVIELEKEIGNLISLDTITSVQNWLTNNGREISKYSEDNMDSSLIVKAENEAGDLNNDNVFEITLKHKVTYMNSIYIGPSANASVKINHYNEGDSVSVKDNIYINNNGELANEENIKVIWKDADGNTVSGEKASHDMVLYPTVKLRVKFVDYNNDVIKNMSEWVEFGQHATINIIKDKNIPANGDKYFSSWDIVQTSKEETISSKKVEKTFASTPITQSITYMANYENEGKLGQLFSVSVKDKVEHIYDGNAVDVSALELKLIEDSSQRELDSSEYTVKYSTDGGKTWSTTFPTLTEVADSTKVKYKIIKDGVDGKIKGNVEINIVEAQQEDAPAPAPAPQDPAPAPVSLLEDDTEDETEDETVDIEDEETPFADGATDEDEQEEEVSIDDDTTPLSATPDKGISPWMVFAGVLAGLLFLLFIVSKKRKVEDEE